MPFIPIGTGGGTAPPPVSPEGGPVTGDPSVDSNGAMGTAGSQPVSEVPDGRLGTSNDDGAFDQGDTMRRGGANEMTSGSADVDDPEMIPDKWGPGGSETMGSSGVGDGEGSSVLGKALDFFSDVFGGD
jgi:hypothetical protein